MPLLRTAQPPQGIGIVEEYTISHLACGNLLIRVKTGAWRRGRHRKPGQTHPRWRSASIDAKAVAGVVESVKAAADVYMPVTGEIAEVNEALRADPSLANTDPLGAGWFFKVKLSNPAELDGLMDETSYTAFSAS